MSINEHTRVYFFISYAWNVNESKAIIYKYSSLILNLWRTRIEAKVKMFMRSQFEFITGAGSCTERRQQIATVNVAGIRDEIFKKFTNVKTKLYHKLNSNYIKSIYSIGIHSNNQSKAPPVIPQGAATARATAQHVITTQNCILY